MNHQCVFIVAICIASIFPPSFGFVIVVNPLSPYQKSQHTAKTKALLRLTANKNDCERKTPPQDVPGGKKAYSQQAPHSGHHFLPSHRATLRTEGFLGKLKRRVRGSNNRRFMEGWYYRVTLTDVGESFAFIFSVEDPHGRSGSVKKSSEYTLSCMQVMGPNDEYLIQADADDSNFWAFKNSMGLGCIFDRYDEELGDDDDRTAMDPQDFRTTVRTGFQVLPRSLQGRIEGHDGTKGGSFLGPGKDSTCVWDMTFDPIYGWGDSDGPQLATAGWLALFPVFEPHWQITLAHARASGTITWKNQTYTFQNMPFYAEKNWGGSFPIKWYWVQCNSFQHYPNLSLTAGGGTRILPFLGGKTEDLGMICVHYDGIFYEIVPWTGKMMWDVNEWGSWTFQGQCTQGTRKFEAEVIATCPEKNPGVKLRAPIKTGMAYFCRDSFYGTVSLSLFHLDYDEISKKYVRSKEKEPIIKNATSYQCAVEVGGGPWWDTWTGKSQMKQPMKAMVKFPYFIRNAKRRIVNAVKKNKSK